jgi:hypothetical protein
VNNFSLTPSPGDKERKAGWLLFVFASARMVYQMRCNSLDNVPACRHTPTMRKMRPRTVRLKKSRSRGDLVFAARKLPDHGVEAPIAKSHETIAGSTPEQFVSAEDIRYEFWAAGELVRKRQQTRDLACTL